MAVALVMKINHVGYGGLFFIITFVVAIAFQSWQIFELEKVVKTTSHNDLLRRLSSFVVIGAVSLKIIHVQYADVLFIAAILISLLINGRHISVLKEKLEQEESFVSQ